MSNKSGEVIVSLRDVAKSYMRGHDRTEILRELNLDIRLGEFLSLMGPSGSGKTTILNLIAGLDRPTAGQVVVNGKCIEQLSEAELTRWRAQHVGFIFQFYNLLPHLTAYANVELPLLLTKLPASVRKKHVELALDIVGLSERLTFKPGQLSGGQQQRIAIARAIVADPAIIVCDEPTGDLDRNTADEILSLLRTLSSRQNKTIIMVTHDPKAADYASRLLYLDKGRLTERERALV